MACNDDLPSTKEKAGAQESRSASQATSAHIAQQAGPAPIEKATYNNDHHDIHKKALSAYALYPHTTSVHLVQNTDFALETAALKDDDLPSR